MSLPIYILFFIAGGIAAYVILKKRFINVNSSGENTPSSSNEAGGVNRESPAGNEKTDINSADLQKQLNNLYLVNELSQRITSSLSLEDSFSHLYYTINSMMDASVMELVVYNGDVKSFFSNMKYEDKDLKLESYNHMSEWCYVNNKEIYLEDAEKNFGRYVFKALTMPDGRLAKSLMCFPVHHHEKIVGTLCIVSFTKDAFEHFHKEIIQLLIPFLGVAINNAANHREMIELKQRAERSEQFMQVFLANMSHEIRTPMNAVMGMTNLLLQKNPLPEQLSYLNTIQKSSDNLLVILNDILDLSKIEAGKMELEKIDFSLTDVVGNVKEIMQFKAEEKGLTLITCTDEKIPPVLIGDPTRLTQILINLTGNAIKFTERGRVELKVVGSAETNNSNPNSRFVRLHFSISDTGIGMSEEQQKKLFQNFSQASTETSRKYGGTGLGLSISKQLVKMKGGEIEIKSKPGKGSTFFFSLEYPVSNNKSVVRKENISDTMLKRLEGKRILLADDNEYNRIVVKETLELKIKGIVVEEATDGLMALQMLETRDYDLVLMDLVMPTLNGLETTQKIRNEFPSPKRNVPIVAITASVVKKEIEKCLNAGMNGFIPKPFKSSEILRTIYNVLYNQPDVVVENKAAVPSNPNGRLIDLNYLREYSEGDEKRMKRFVELFISRSPHDIAELKNALVKNDFEQIRIIAHSMKSQLKFNGIVEGFDIAGLIEQNCMNNFFEDIPVLIERLNEVCVKAVQEMKEMKLT